MLRKALRLDPPGERAQEDRGRDRLPRGARSSSSAARRTSSCWSARSSSIRPAPARGRRSPPLGDKVAERKSQTNRHIAAGACGLVAVLAMFFSSPGVERSVARSRARRHRSSAAAPVSCFALSLRSRPVSRPAPPPPPATASPASAPPRRQDSAAPPQPPTCSRAGPGRRLERGPDLPAQPIEEAGTAERRRPRSRRARPLSRRARRPHAAVCP